MTRTNAIATAKKASHDALFDLFASRAGAEPPLRALQLLAGADRAARSRAKMLSARDRARARSTFAYLLARGYIAFAPEGGSVTLAVTPKGKNKLQAKAFPKLLAAARKRPAAWDGKWRLILFDIPASERARRNAFRALIRKLGAVMIQKSVWAYPYDCSHEIGALAKYFGFGGSELRLVVAEDIAGDDSLAAHFRLTRPRC